MNEELEDILKRQPLRRPSDALDARVCGDRSGRARVAGWIGFASALAACLVVVLSIDFDAAPRGAENHASGTLPARDGVVRIDEVLSEFTEGELFVTDDNDPVRPVYVQQTQRTRWVDEKRNVRIEMTVPRDRVVLLSAPIQ